MPRRGQIRKRDNGKYLARVYVGKGPDGKRHWLSKTFGKKKEAEAWLAEQLSDKAQGTFQAPSKENLAQYLTRWLNDVAARRIRERTRDDYEIAISQYLVPRIGHIKLSELRPDQVQKAYNDIETNNGPHIARKCHAILHSALSQAEKWGLVARNVASLAEPPKVPRREMRPLSPEEVSKFVAAIQDNRYGAYFLLLLDTGMRPGEALALTWDDVDLENGVIHINKALSTGRPKLYMGEGKTAKSRRSVVITPSTVATLKAHKAHIAQERLKAGQYWEDNNLVFPNSFGGYSDQHNIARRYFKPVLRDLGLPESIRIYDLRHTVATLLLAANTHPKLVAERLGHANTTLTLDRYTHVLPTMQNQVAATMQMFLDAQEAHKRK